MNTEINSIRLIAILMSPRRMMRLGEVITQSESYIKTTDKLGAMLKLRL